MRWPFFAGIAILAALSGLAPALAGESVVVGKPWARASVGPNGAAYMTLSVTDSQPDRLTAAESPAAKAVELHTHVMDGGVMKMRAVEGIDVLPGAPTELKPGGLHLMLMGVAAPLREGERFPLTLTFARAGRKTIEVAIGAPGATAAP